MQRTCPVGLSHYGVADRFIVEQHEVRDAAGDCHAEGNIGIGLTGWKPIPYFLLIIDSRSKRYKKCFYLMGSVQNACMVGKKLVGIRGVEVLYRDTGFI